MIKRERNRGPSERKKKSMRKIMRLVMVLSIIVVGAAAFAMMCGGHGHMGPGHDTGN